WGILCVLAARSAGAGVRGAGLQCPGAPLALPLPLPFGYLHAVPTAGAFPTPAVSPPTPEVQAMAEDRNQQPDPPPASLAPLITAEVLRNAASSYEPKAKGRGEDGVSPFWRIFGATILSIVALAAVTLYQQLAGGLSEVRHELGQMTKKEEFVASRSKVWEKFFEI